MSDVSIQVTVLLSSRDNYEHIYIVHSLEIYSYKDNKTRRGMIGILLQSVARTLHFHVTLELGC